MKKFTLLACGICGLLHAGDPIVEWSFDESIHADRGGTGIVQDIASKKGAAGVKATVSGTKKTDVFLVDGIRGKAYRIHHDSDTKAPVTLSYTPVPALNSPAGAVSFWIKPEWDGKENVRRIFYSADSGSHRIIIFRLPKIPHITFYYGKLNGQGVTSLPVDISKWKKGEWHHMVMTWDKNSMHVFVDGKKSVLPMKAVFMEPFKKVMIGENWGDQSGQTVIDELAVYNTKLSDADAGALYNAMSRQLMKKQSKAPLTVKLSSSTPAADGKVSEGEYAFSASGMRNIRDNTAFAAQQSRCFLSYDSENLYWAMTGPANQIQALGNKRDTFNPLDDSVEFWLKFPEEEEFYQFLINASGNIYDRRGTNLKWNAAGIRTASRINGNVWTLECVIPWKNFPFKAVPGNKFRFDFCRSYMKSAMFTAFGSCAHAYGIIPNFAEAELAPEAPVLNLGYFGNLPKGEIDCNVLLRSKQNDNVKVSFNAGRGLYPLDYNRMSRLTPGKNVQFSVKNTNIPLNTVIDIQIESEKSGVLYSNSFPYVEHQEIKFDTLYTNIKEQKLYFRFQNLKPFGTQYSFAFKILDKNGKSLLEQQKQIPNNLMNTEISFDISSLPHGVFKLEYSVLDSQGNVILKDYEHYGKYREDQWRNNDGLEDTIPPPWTPLKASAETFECWGRTIVFGKNSFLRSVKSQGLELLSGPVDLILNGKKVSFTSKLIKEGVSFKEYELQSIGCTPSLKLRIRAEFDGILWCNLVSGAGKINSLKLQIPLKREYAAGFDDCSSIFEKTDLSSMEEGSLTVDSVLKPYWWCGNGKIGLMGGLTSQRGRYLKNKPQSMTVNIRKDTVMLEMMFVDTALNVETSRTFSFYFQPTPVKPKNHSMAKIRNDRNAWTWISGVSTHFAYGRDGFWKEDNIRKFRDYEERDPNWTNIWYMATKGASPYTPEWGWFSHLWHDCHPGFAIYQVDSAVKNKAARNRGVFAYGCMNSKSFMEFKFDLAKERLKRSEIVNLYYDLAWPKPCHNTQHGCTYKDEFGYTHHEYDLLPLREYYLRTYRWMKKKNPDSVMTGHIISTRLPSDSFFDMLWLGEAYDQKIAKSGGYYDILTPEVTRISYADRSNEMTIALIAQFGRALQLFAPDRFATFNPKSPKSQKAFKHYYAYIFLHNMNSSMTHYDEEYLKAQDKLGWGNGKVRFFGYWDSDSPLKTVPSGKRYLASGYAGNGNFFAVVLNDTDKPVELTLNIDFKRIGLKTGMKGVEVMTGEKYPFANGTQRLKLGARDARMIMFSEK